MFTKIKTDKEIEAMRQGGKILATVLDFLDSRIRSGMSTKDLADLAARELKALGGQPAFLGYQGYPDVLCVSVNDEVVHGIPRADTVLNEGDVASLDFGVTYRGLITDGAISVIVGDKVAAKTSNLVKATEASLYAGIDVVRHGVRIGNVSQAIQTVLDAGKFGIVRDLVGHGVGHELHEDPNIPNYGSNGSGPMLQAGMTVAIEPMATLGGDEVYVAADGWTVVTADHSLAAHFEHTVLVTEKGFEVLTQI